MSPWMPATVGVCSWSLRPADAEDLAAKVAQTGLSAVQLHLNPLDDQPATWGNAGPILRDAGIRIVSGMFHCIGEDYSTLESIRLTGGLTPAQHWQGNLLIADRAATQAKALGLDLITSHLGFIPESREGEPADRKAYETLLSRAREVAGVLAAHGQKWLLETGQETAATLLHFLADLHQAGATNVGVNFDPANMILYGKGEPVAALTSLLPHVGQVHIKDALPSAVPGQWGRETPVGQGAVDWPRFFAVLRQARFSGPLMIEREGGATAMADVRQAGRFLTELQ